MPLSKLEQLVLAVGQVVLRIADGRLVVSIEATRYVDRKLVNLELECVFAGTPGVELEWKAGQLLDEWVQMCADNLDV